MAPRTETRSRQAALRRDLRQLRSDGGQVGDPLLPVRDLAQRYDLSVTLVTRELRKLQDEGVLHTIPRVGTFLGPRRAEMEGALVLLTVPGHHFLPVRAAFEAHATERGRIPLVLPADTLRRLHTARALPAVDGMFEFAEIDDPSVGELFPGARHVRFGDDRPGTHTIRFDDVTGGYDATRHLLTLGHRRIAFVGVHVPGGDKRLRWSERRLEGWRRALKAAGCAEGSTLILPREELSVGGLRYFAEPERILEEIDSSCGTTGLVVATQQAALEVLDTAGPNSRLEHLALVTFDYEHLDERSGLLTTMRLPWERVGRLAVEILLGSAKTGTHLLAMELVPRLSSVGPHLRTLAPDVV